MKNGNYLIEHKSLGTQYRLRTYNGSYKLFNPNSEQFIRNINKWYFEEFYKVLEELPKETKLYDVYWFINGVVKERIPIGGSYAVAMSKISQLKQTTHKTGLLAPIKKNN